MIALILFFSAGASTLLYLYLHKKTHINLSYLYKDNVLNIAISSTLTWYFIKFFSLSCWAWIIVLILIVVPTICISLTIIRFYRIPLRRVKNNPTEILSPADGNIIYIKKIKAGETPISVKNGKEATLTEFTKTELIDCPCWLIGINMTPFDVHKNSAPCEGKIILNKHIDGEFLSLKDENALQRNERNSLVIENQYGKIGIVQTASRLVRRIVTYKEEGDNIKQGDWFGMIKFGSQVDIILPANCKLKVDIKQQVFARKSVIAEW